MLAMLTARPWPHPLLLTALFLLVMAAATMLACGPVAQPAPADGNVFPAAQPDGDADPPPPPPAPTFTYPNIGDSQLEFNVVEFEESQDAASGPSGQSGEVVEDATVFVLVSLSSNTDAVASWLESNGAPPIHKTDGYLEVAVPLSLLGELSQQNGVTEIRRPAPSFLPVR